MPPPPPIPAPPIPEKGIKIACVSYLENIQKTEVEELMKAQLKEDKAAKSGFRVLGDFSEKSFWFCKGAPTFPDWCDAEIGFNEFSDCFVMKFKEKK
eukprot:290780_1